jgi:hypothetical protein
MKKSAHHEDGSSSFLSLVSHENTHNTTKSVIHPNAPDEIRKNKQWLTKQEFLTLETEGKRLPNKVFDCLEVMLLHHLTDTDNHNIFVANHKLMTDAIDSNVEMTKSDLFTVIR